MNILYTFIFWTWLQIIEPPIQKCEVLFPLRCWQAASCTNQHTVLIVICNGVFSGSQLTDCWTRLFHAYKQNIPRLQQMMKVLFLVLHAFPTSCWKILTFILCPKWKTETSLDICQSLLSECSICKYFDMWFSTNTGLMGWCQGSVLSVRAVIESWNVTYWHSLSVIGYLKDEQMICSLNLSEVIVSLNKMSQIIWSVLLLHRKSILEIYIGTFHIRHKFCELQSCSVEKKIIDTDTCYTHSMETLQAYILSLRKQSKAKNKELVLFT